MSAPLLVIAAGGTGGHMFPAQALAEEMLARGWRVTLTTDARGVRYAGGFPEEVERVELPSASTGQGGLAARLAAPFTILRGVLRARALFRSDRPACVAGFGGYPSLPALSASVLMGLPRFIHEQNGVLGRVNRLFAARVALVCCGTWPVTNPPPRARLEHLGNPIRGAASALVGDPYCAPDPEARVSLLIFGGSQGASAFARLVPPAVAALPEAVRERLDVTQQVRVGEEDAVAAIYREAGVEARINTFFDDMPRRIASAQLVIARAGASTVAELTAIGRPSILVPYPHAMDDHQSANAAALSDAGAAEVIVEAGLDAETLSATIGALLDNPERLSVMAEAARGLGRPDAAARLADIVAGLGKGPRG